MAIEIANATDKRKYRVSICVTRSETSLAPCIRPHVDLFVLDRRRRLDAVKLAQFNAYCQEQNVALFHVHGWSSMLLVAFMHLRYRSLWKKGLVFHDHYGDVEINPHHPAAVRAAMLWLRPQYVGVHRKLSKMALNAGLKEERVSTIQNAIDFSIFQRKSMSNPFSIDLNGAKLTGIVVANVRPSKDILLLLRALALLNSRDWQIAIVGAQPDSDYYATCLGLIQELGLERRVHFLGARLDVSNLTCWADFGVLSSKTESGPLVLIEYAAAALPFASTHVGLVGDTLYHKGVPGFVAPGDDEGLALALEHLLELPREERENRGELGRQLAAEFFDIQAVMPAWHNVYEKALQDRER